jgi:RNA polymerase sigma-70 factor (ECF subfamily)
MPREGDTGPDDLGLMRGIEARDPVAMEVLFDRHARGLLAACRRVVGNRCDAEDALEAVFLELWQHPERFDAARGSPRAYLELLARSRALDLLRSRSRAERRVWAAHGAGALEGSAPEACAPLSGVLHQERCQHLRRAVDGLEPGQRQVIEMAFFQDMTHARIAESLALPLGTVKSRMRAGLRMLRRRLGQRDLDTGEDT